MRYTILFLFFISLLSFQANAQEMFERGYYINSGQTKVEGLISLNSVTNSEPFILFKSTHKSDADTVFHKHINELKVSGFKYIRNETRILSSESTLEEEKFFRQNKLLKVELEGRAVLYSIEKDEKYTFYYSVPGQVPEQLVYAQYIRNDGQTARKNTFRDQLSENVNCGDQNFSSLRYNRFELINVFKAYNECSDSDYKTYQGIPALSWKYLNIGLGTGISGNFVESTNTVLDTEIARFSTIAPYFEVDVEYLLPSINNRIGFFFTGGYLQFSDSDQRTILGSPQTIDLTYEVIQTSIGVRGYLPLGNQVKAHAELGFGRDFEVGKGISIDYELGGNGYNDFNDPQMNGHLTGGLGLTVFNRYILEAKFRHLNTRLSDISSDQKVKQGILTIGFKYLLKSYYK